MDLVQIETSDSLSLYVPRAVATILLQGEIHDDSVPRLPVTQLILTKVCEYCAYHQTTESDDAWDEAFCRVDHDTLFKLILAANAMNIAPLLKLTCRTVVTMIKGMSPEEIRCTLAV